MTPGKAGSAHLPGLRRDPQLPAGASDPAQRPPPPPPGKGRPSRGGGIRCCHSCRTRRPGAVTRILLPRPLRPAPPARTPRLAPRSGTPALTFPRCSALLAHSPYPGAGAAWRSVPGNQGRAGGVGAAHRRLPAQPPEPPLLPPPPPSMAAAPPPDNGSDAPPPPLGPAPQPRPSPRAPPLVCVYNPRPGDWGAILTMGGSLEAGKQNPIGDWFCMGTGPKPVKRLETETLMGRYLPLIYV